MIPREHIIIESTQSQKKSNTRLRRDLNQPKIKPFIILLALHRSVLTSLRGPFPRHCTQATQFLSKKMLQGWRAVGNTASDLTDLRFKPQTSRSRDELVTLDQQAQLKATNGRATLTRLAVLFRNNMYKNLTVRSNWL